MSEPQPGRLRRQLLLPAFIPVAVGVAGLVPQLGSVAVCVAGFVGGLVSAAAAWRLTRPIAELGAEAQKVLDGSDSGDSLLSARTDEVGLVARALAELEGRRRDTASSAQADLAATAAAFGALAESGRPAHGPALRGEYADAAAQVTGAFNDLAKHVTQGRQRLAAALRILHGQPNPVVVADDRGGVRYLNPAAERLLGRTTQAAARKPVHALVAAPVQADPLGRPTFGTDGPAGWEGHPATEWVASAASAGGYSGPVGLTAVRLNGGDRDMAWCLAVRDLSGEYERLEADRAATRAQAMRAAWADASRLGGDATDAIQAQVRLLTGDAKQSRQRDALLPKLAAVRQQAAGLDLYFRSVRWLAGGLWEGTPRPQPAEFIAGEVARAAAEQLAARFKVRGNTITVTDHGGWVFCDEERLRTALLGLLTHAAEAAQNMPIGLNLSRIDPTPGSPEGSVVFEVSDAGPALTATERRALDDPFGGLDTPPLLLGTAGYAPGLLLAHRLAAEMGGLVQFDATPSDRLVARLVLPSRLAPTQDAAPGELDGAGPAEELCMGWQLGTPS